MPSLSLKIILEDGAVTRTMKFPNGCTVADAAQMVEEKVLTGAAGKDYGLFLTSADDELSGCWLEDPRRLDYYLLKDGDSLHYRCRVRTLRIRMLDGSVKTMQVDESKSVETLMMNVCSKLGITNHEEYGLCREDEPMEEHPATGTLTLKRKHQHKEKDAALQQLSKKLKTDDNVEWLEQHKTLREMAVAPTETLLLKRRLFYSDRKVDARDPVQLNLLYVQARDAVLEGRHPVTEEQAVTFAGIQCQIQYGDYQEEKHKQGFIENLSEFLPQNYANSRGMEKKVTKEHKNHAGLTQLEAKHLYTKTARDLPSYGVTFFLVKEMQKGKKKLVPRLLGINASSILRLDETTKEVLQTWPLTQVKTYKAGRGDMFTLNFGDYSEKEYCVKTNDAYRIRDILQGYIDLHRKRIEAAFNTSGDEGGIIHTATVESGKGSTMEVVSHSAHKTVETSFVGPSKIISAEEGSKAQAHGAQIVTAHTVIVTNKQLNEQSAKATGVTMRGEMSINIGRKLNELNGNAVKIVTLLNDPNEANIEAAKQIVETIVRDMPPIVAGVKHCIDQQTDEAARKKLTMELNELNDSVNQLNGFVNPQDAQEAAMRIADLTTQMYFALDGPSKRRSQLIRNSRKSFIEDEKTQATLQRASFINCVGAANHAMDEARDILATKYEGQALSPHEVENLERSARDRLARLNAAIARLAAAHADPKNIDYAAAVSAMNTIKELVPKLAKDCQILSAVRDGKDRTGLIKEMQELLDATGMISQNIGCDDSKKMRDEADEFAKKSRRLQFIFGHGVHPDMENEILDLTKDVDNKTRLLVATVGQLAGEVNDPASPKIINAAHKCANAATGLTSCAQLTAPSIHEPHCRSAFLAALEDLASSEKLLDAAYRSLLDHPEGRKRSDDVKNQSAELRKALDRLRNVCDELENDYGDGPEATERKRLRFITNMSGAQKSLDSCNRILEAKYKGQAISPVEAELLERSARDKLDRLNAAIARLAAAHADPKNIDYAAANSAMITINELAPELANDAQALSTVKDGKDRTSLTKEMQDLLDATGMIYQSLGSDDLQGVQNATNMYTKKAKRLQFILGNGNDATELEQKQQDFARSLTGLQETIDTCDKILTDNSNQQRSTLPERPLWYSLGELNAAIGSLLAATKDKENPDYEAAEVALVNIASHMPDVIEEMKRKASIYPPAKREQVLADIQALNDAVRALAVHTNNGEDVNQAIADYTKASGKLTYVFDTHASQPKEHELIDLTKKVCGTTSELLAHVYGVAAEVGGEAGYDLDVTGSKVAESAEDLLTSVQLTAHTIHIPPCKTMVLQSAKDLSYALDNVARTWPAACNKEDDKNKLEKMKIQANQDLQNLINAVEIVAEPTESSLDNKRKDLQGALLRAQDVIKQPLSSKPVTPAEEKTLQHSLANKLAALNAAIAGLMNASYGRDPSKIDHNAAELSMGVIERLLPEIVQDIRALNSGKSDAETRALMEELEALCAATNTLANESGHGNPAVLKTFADQYAKSSGRLAFICTPTTAAQKNQGKVIHKAQDVFDRSSMMVEAVDKLVKSHPNDFRNKALDEKAQLVERAACALLGTAQVTASTLNAPHCRSALHQAARDLSQAISQLDTATHQLVGADLLGQQRKNFDEAVRELMATITGLEEDSKQLNASAKTMSAEKEKNRLKFVASRSAAQTALDSAVEELKKTGKVAPLAPPQAALLQARLADKLATLNAAIATLLTATRDPENPDYVLAESATATIQELVPDLIKDAKTLPSGKDQTARSKLLEHLQELCEATKAISSGENSGKEKELQEAVEKYTQASGKLVYTFNPRANAAKEDQIIDLTKSTCQKTSELLERVYDLAQEEEGQAAVDLDAQGSRLADAAQNLLTTAEITAPSISSPLCQSSLLTSVSALSSSVDHLFSSPVLTLPQHAAKRQHLQEARAKVDQEIERLRQALKDERVLDAAAIEKAKKEKLRFIASMASTEVAIQNAEKEITEPYGKPLPAPAVASLQESLANRLASLNAAINSLVVATNDHNNPDYLEAESVSKTIRELIPDIVKDSKSLSSTMDQASRKDLLEQIKALCEATRLLGASAKPDQLSPEELNKAATQFSLASGKLNFVFNPQVDQKKTHQIIGTCKSACIKISEMLQKVQDLAKQAGADGSALETKGAQVSDAARSLLTTAQLTAHSVNSPLCQTALLDSSDRLSASIQELQTTWMPVTKAPKFKAVGEQLAKDKEALEAEVVTLRRLVNDGTGVKGKKPPVPTRTDSDKASKKRSEARMIGATREFLDMLRSESSMEKENCGELVKSPTSPSHPRTDEEKHAKHQFTKSIQDARKSICSAEEILQTALIADGKDRASLDDAQIIALNKQMEHKLARANAAAAHLLASRGGDKPDYKIASKCVGAVSDLMPSIAADAITLADLKDPVGRKLFLSDTMGLCTASKNLCDTAKSDKKKLKDVALEFGNQSSKLLYAISTDIDPSQEKEVLLRVKAAGDVACRVTEGSVEGPAAGRCAGQATVLMYTAKLVAPSIQDSECQDALITASKDLSTQLKTITSTNPKLTQELMELEMILEALRNDVASQTLVKRKEEKLVIEDTPLRKLTAQIIEDCKQNAEDTNNPAAERKAMADFANKLTDALRAMDVANARCKKAPHDLRRREELEDAVLNLQHLVLQCRPRVGAADAAQNNIVNLSDYLQDVSTNAERLERAAQEQESAPGPHARAATTLRAQCARLLHAATAQHDSHVLDVDHVAKVTYVTPRTSTRRIERLERAAQEQESAPGPHARAATTLRAQCARLLHAATAQHDSHVLVVDHVAKVTYVTPRTSTRRIERLERAAQEQESAPGPHARAATTLRAQCARLLHAATAQHDSHVLDVDHVAKVTYVTPRTSTRRIERLERAAQEQESAPGPHARAATTLRAQCARLLHAATAQHDSHVLDVDHVAKVTYVTPRTSTRRIERLERAAQEQESAPGPHARAATTLRAQCARLLHTATAQHDSHVLDVDHVAKVTYVTPRTSTRRIERLERAAQEQESAPGPHARAATTLRAQCARLLHAATAQHDSHVLDVDHVAKVTYVTPRTSTRRIERLERAAQEQESAPGPHARAATTLRAQCARLLHAATAQHDSHVLDVDHVAKVTYVTPRTSTRRIERLERAAQEQESAPGPHARAATTLRAQCARLLHAATAQHDSHVLDVDHVAKVTYVTPRTSTRRIERLERAAQEQESAPGPHARAATTLRAQCARLLHAATAQHDSHVLDVDHVAKVTYVTPRTSTRRIERLERAAQEQESAPGPHARAATTLRAQCARLLHAATAQHDSHVLDVDHVAKVTYVTPRTSTRRIERLERAAQEQESAPGPHARAATTLRAQCARLLHAATAQHDSHVLDVDHVAKVTYVTPRTSTRRIERLERAAQEQESAPGPHARAATTLRAQCARLLHAATAQHDSHVLDVDHVAKVTYVTPRTSTRRIERLERAAQEQESAPGPHARAATTLRAQCARLLHAATAQHDSHVLDVDHVAKVTYVTPRTSTRRIERLERAAQEQESAPGPHARAATTLRAQCARLLHAATAQHDSHVLDVDHVAKVTYVTPRTSTRRIERLERAAQEQESAPGPHARAATTLRAQCARLLHAATAQHDSHVLDVDHVAKVTYVTPRTSTRRIERLERAAQKQESAPGPHARAATTLRAQCARLLHAATAQHDSHVLDVDHVAKECVGRVQKINTTIECCPEGAGKKNLQKEARPLNESCTLLQFASLSAIATTQCAAIDEALNDLTDLESRIDKMLQPRKGDKHIAKSTPSASLLASRARLATAAAAVNRDAQELAPAFTRYLADMRAHVDVSDDQKRYRLADHLKKLQDRLKVLTMETGRQVVTWRPANEGEVVTITDEVLKELDNAEAVIGAKTDRSNTVAYEDLRKLLLPVDTYTMEGDKKKLEAKLEPYASKLNSMAETLTLSIGKPDSLARTAHVTAESAVQLTALAKALKCDEEPTKNSKIDEASQELCFVTYNLLKTAESAGNVSFNVQEPNTFESRRRMIDACRSLSDAINKLVRVSSSGDKMQRECNEMNRALQLRQSTVQPRPTCALTYAECISALQTQHEAIRNLKSEEPVSREEFSDSLDYLTSAVNSNVDYAEHCAYLLTLSEHHPVLSKEGMFDTERIQKLIANAQDSCFRVTRPGIVHQAKEESSLLSKQLDDLKQAIQECSSKVRDEAIKKRLMVTSTEVDAAGKKLISELHSSHVSLEKLTPSAFATIEELSALRTVTEDPLLTPLPTPSPAAQKRADEVIQQSKELLTRASGLMRAIKTSEDQQAMTWVMFNTYTKGVIEISEKLVICIKDNGQQAGLIEGSIEEDDGDMTAVSYVQTQVLIANKWLQKPSYKAHIKTDGEQAARNVIDVGKKMLTHLKEADREEMKHLVEECEQLLQQCSDKYTLETGSVLMDRLKDLAKAVDRSIVTMVVEDLLEDEEPLADLDLLVDAERDEAKRKFLLERKIADLLAHLGRVTKTARVVADGQGGDSAELRKCTSQAELFAPMLVKAAEKRVIHHTDTAIAEEYRTQLAQYSQSLSKVRDLCDRAVDPMQFVQTAEETMQRMKEESTAHQNDLQKCSSTSTAIRKLAHRVINVSMSSQNAQRDPELMRALTAAQQKLKEAEPARTLRASKLPDLRNNIAEILRATGEVESVLGGEMIFQKQRESDQPIYNAALNLHAAVREWSARDNEIVAVAKRMAVLMAKLSDHMHADKKREVISTSKAIVAASHEVAHLARKLALECTDMRIRTNLLQVCDQIPTISGQLKMLTTVKGSFLGHQGSDEDIEAMNMLIGNAQNLMMSIQDVVKAAASASVKIRSQRGGPKIRWVRKNYH